LKILVSTTFRSLEAWRIILLPLSKTQSCTKKSKHKQ